VLINVKSAWDGTTISPDLFALNLCGLFGQAGLCGAGCT
jgi:hypothetical protein